MKIAAYLRVSTDQQTHDSQRAELEDYCKRRGWTDVSWITDTASGAKASREGLDQIMALVRRGKVDVVISYKLDRLARSLVHLAQIIQELQTHGVALVVCTQNIDTTENSPSARFQLHILAAVAELERSLILERVQSGIKAARQRGVRLGRPPKAQTRVPLVAALLAEGLSAAEISRKLAIPYSTASELVRELRSKLAGDCIGSGSN